MVGVIYNPFLEETYTAWLGGGAYLNGRRLRVASAKARDKCGSKGAGWSDFFACVVGLVSHTHIHT